MDKRLQEIKDEVNKLPKSWFFNSHANYLIETIEKQQEILEAWAPFIESGDDDE